MAWGRATSFFTDYRLTVAAIEWQIIRALIFCNGYRAADEKPAAQRYSPSASRKKPQNGTRAFSRAST